MINFNALFSISYGLYVICSGDKDKGNGYISNTFFQVSNEPIRFAACCNKNNYTAVFIDEKACFSVSILHKETETGLFGKFGYKSGREINKMEGMNILYGQTGAPVILDDSVAYIECKVVDKFDIGTHWLFIGEIVDAQMIDQTLEPMTYAFYREVKKGIAPKNAPTYIDKSILHPEPKSKNSGIFKCTACGHIYDENEEEIKFVDLPDDWKCPICGADKEDFIEI